ncbi:TLC domain-containing protein 4-like isoform X2 [Lineus longissimus]
MMMDDLTFYSFGTCLAAITFIAVQDFIGPFFSSLVCPKYETLPRQVRLEWDGKVCSTVHAIYMATSATIITLTEPDSFFNSFRDESFIMKIVYAVIVGYEIADLRHMVVKKTFETPYVIHHSSVIVCGFYCMFINSTVDYYLYLRLLSEYAVPFVNLRWILRYPLDYPIYSKLYIGNGVIILLTYTFFRVGIIPFYYYKVYEGASTAVLPHVCGAVMDMLNIWWYSKVLAAFRRGLFGDRKSNEVHVEGNEIKKGKRD